MKYNILQLASAKHFAIGNLSLMFFGSFILFLNREQKSDKFTTFVAISNTSYSALFTSAPPAVTNTSFSYVTYSSQQNQYKVEEQKHQKVERSSSRFSHQVAEVTPAIRKTFNYSSQLSMISPLYQGIHINCKVVFEGEASYVKQAINISKLISGHNMAMLNSTFYLDASRNCSHFIESRGYITWPLSQLEYDFPIAYSILAFKDIEMLERLLRSIYRPQNFYCIHIDLKSDEDYFKAVESISMCFENVFLTRKRISVIWGTFSILEPELMCMELLWKRQGWKYFINLTGQEFPLKTNYELVKILTAYNGANDISATIKR